MTSKTVVVVNEYKDYESSDPLFVADNYEKAINIIETLYPQYKKNNNHYWNGSKFLTFSTVPINPKRKLK